MPRAPATELAVRAVICSALLCGPPALAFFSGGLDEGARNLAAIVAWGLVAGAALVVRAQALPRRRAGLLAIGGLVGLTALVSLSGLWAPLGGPALDDRVRLALYLAVFVLAAVAWPSRRVARMAEPAFAAGALGAVGYGLSERLLPDVVTLERNLTASGLLDQPVTYWNALGAIAAVGIVLCARLCGDEGRPAGLRSAAAGALAPLGSGLMLTQSRGAIAALAAGLAMLVLLAPERRQLRAATMALAGAGSGAVLVGFLPAVQDYLEPLSQRRLQGLILLAGLAVVAVASIVAERTTVAASGRSALPRPGRALAPLAVIALVAVLVPALAGGAGRGVGGNRAEYWRVAVGTFTDHPVRGAGSGAFITEWARQREIEESVQDGHSLYLETAAELGLLGLVALALFLTGVILAARAAHRRDASLAAGPCAVLVLFAVHAAVDWDWEVPALTMPVLVLAGVLVWRENLQCVSEQPSG